MRLKIKAQGKMLELIIGGIFVIFILISIYGYYMYIHYKNIEELVKRSGYEIAMLTYKIAQSDQLLSISSQDKGFLDLSKLEGIEQLGDNDTICTYIENILNSKIYVYIKDLDTNKEYEICKRRKSMPLYFFDLYINIYDSYNDKVHIGYMKIGVVS